MNECFCDETQGNGELIETALLEAEHIAVTTDLRYSAEEVYERLKSSISE